MQHRNILRKENDKLHDAALDSAREHEKMRKRCDAAETKNATLTKELQEKDKQLMKYQQQHDESIEKEAKRVKSHSATVEKFRALLKTAEGRYAHLEEKNKALVAAAAGGGSGAAASSNPDVDILVQQLATARELQNGAEETATTLKRKMGDRIDNTLVLQDIKKRKMEVEKKKKEVEAQLERSKALHTEAQSQLADANASIILLEGQLQQ